MFESNLFDKLKRNFLLFLFFLVVIQFTSSARNNRYDKSISIFSPEGELTQIKYADRAGANGLSLVCISTDENSIVLCTPAAPSNSLLDRRCIDKVSKVDEGVWIVFAGLVGDGRHVTLKARQFCNDFQVKFGCRPTVSAVAQHIGSLQHEVSLTGGSRPLGLHVLCVGFDEGVKASLPSIFLSKASGEVTQWRATAIGKHADKSVALLEDAISEPLDEKKAIEIATRILSQACRLGSSPKGEGEGEGDVDPDSMIDLYIISSNGDDKQSLVRRTISI